MDHIFNVFKPCPLKEGQKIRIEDSPIAGDWEIIRVSPYKITLRCPVSGKELTKDRFLFFVEESQGKWPR
ncbi:MAG: hypothetical protein U9P10_06725 [Thermodesulfobacteriota bacterium]|nr:hypothetical protein [Thermodesulfobacteriota bacterium]